MDDLLNLRVIIGDASGSASYVEAIVHVTLPLSMEVFLKGKGMQASV